jgi:hypothetical protein
LESLKSVEGIAAVDATSAIANIERGVIPSVVGEKGSHCAAAEGTHFLLDRFPKKEHFSMHENFLVGSPANRQQSTV